PVLVFIHDYSRPHQTGTGNAFDGSVMAAYGKMAVITLNYRIGVFGFLPSRDLSDGSVQANQGVSDVITALTWISENIESFGGDRSRVTVMGEGGGADMLGLILYS
ncbi:hypothetical protein HELRODRAFT_125958, partial [Helobdella robusta]|uniref:Carboxylesterase type B domain-containing protein n=1 Tax=Helobdella robusta TaxID=6412 RepID=T1EH77_HELRO